MRHGDPATPESLTLLDMRLMLTNSASVEKI